MRTVRHCKQIELNQYFIWTIHELYMDCTWTILEPYINLIWTIPRVFTQFMYSSLLGICNTFNKGSPFLKTLSYALILTFTWVNCFFENSFLTALFQTYGKIACHFTVLFQYVHKSCTMFYHMTIRNYVICTIDNARILLTLIKENHQPNSYGQLFLLQQVVSYRTKSKQPTRRRWQRRWQRSSNRGGKLCLDLFVFFLFLSIKGEVKRSQVNVMKLIWEEIRDGVRPAKQRYK